MSENATSGGVTKEIEPPRPSARGSTRPSAQPAEVRANAPFACPYAFRKSDVGPVASPDDFLARYSLDELFGPRKRR